MAIKLADTLAPMSEFPAAMAEHIGFSDGATLQEKFDNKELGGGDSSVTLTQQEYEALTKEQKLDGLYYTYDTKRIYKNGVQYGASEPITLTMEEYKILFQSQQAQMRAQLLKDYKEYDKKGYVLDIELKDWENQYQAYHQLGANGVLDDRYKRLLELPDNPPDENDTSEN